MFQQTSTKTPKVLLTHRFFWPDSAPYGLMLRDLGDHFAQLGLDVHVFSALPPDSKTRRIMRREIHGEVSVRRCGVLREKGRPSIVRAMNAAWYCTALFFHILRLRPAVVTAASFPPVVAAATASLAARLVGARFVYHVQDIHPEVSEVISARMGRGVARRFFLWLDNATLQRAAQVVTLSHDMKETLTARGVAIQRLAIIENLALDHTGTSHSTDPALFKSANRIRVIFAGNLGRFQNLPELAQGLGEVFAQYPKLELCFLGEGAAKADLMRLWGDHPQVTFLPQVSVADARAILTNADIGLISLQAGMYRVAFPSKYQTYVSLGLPIVALIEPDSQMARTILEHNQGAVADVRAPHSVADAVRTVIEQLPMRLEHDPQAAKAEIMRNWTKVMTELFKPLS